MWGRNIKNDTKSVLFCPFYDLTASKIHPEIPSGGFIPPEEPEAADYGRASVTMELLSGRFRADTDVHCLATEVASCQVCVHFGESSHPLRIQRHKRKLKSNAGRKKSFVFGGFRGLPYSSGGCEAHTIRLMWHVPDVSIHFYGHVCSSSSI